MGCGTAGCGICADPVLASAATAQGRPSAFPSSFPFGTVLPITSSACCSSSVIPRRDHLSWGGGLERSHDGTLQITSPVKILCGGRALRFEGSARPVRSRPGRTSIACLRRAHAELNACGIDLADTRTFIRPRPRRRGCDLRKLTGARPSCFRCPARHPRGLQPTGLKLSVCARASSRSGGKASAGRRISPEQDLLPIPACRHRSRSPERSMRPWS